MFCIIIFKLYPLAGLPLFDCIAKLVILEGGATDLRQIINDVIQFLRRTNQGLKSLESITVGENRVIYIPVSRLLAPGTNDLHVLTVSC